MGPRDINWLHTSTEPPHQSWQISTLLFYCLINSQSILLQAITLRNGIYRMIYLKLDQQKSKLHWTDLELWSSSATTSAEEGAEEEVQVIVGVCRPQRSMASDTVLVDRRRWYHIIILADHAAVLSSVVVVDPRLSTQAGRYAAHRRQARRRRKIRN